MKKSASAFAKLTALIEVKPGDIIHCKDYHFSNTGVIRDKYFIVIYADKEENDVYGYFATTNLYHYPFCVLTQCHLKTSKPCYFLDCKDGKGFGFFPQPTVIQFLNLPEVTHSSLITAMTSGAMSRVAQATDTDMFQLLNCIKNQPNIERYYKSKIAPIINSLRVKLYPEQ